MAAISVGVAVRYASFVLPFESLRLEATTANCIAASQIVAPYYGFLAALAKTPPTGLTVLCVLLAVSYKQPPDLFAKHIYEVLSHKSSFRGRGNAGPDWFEIIGAGLLSESNNPTVYGVGVTPLAIRCYSGA